MPLFYPTTWRHLGQVNTGDSAAFCWHRGCGIPLKRGRPSKDNIHKKNAKKQQEIHIELMVSMNGGNQNGCFIMESPFQMHHLGVQLFSETPKYGVHMCPQCHDVPENKNPISSNLQTEQDVFWHKYDRHQARVLWALRTQRWIKQFAQPVPIVSEHNTRAHSCVLSP